MVDASIALVGKEELVVLVRTIRKEGVDRFKSVIGREKAGKSRQRGVTRQKYIAVYDGRDCNFSEKLRGDGSGGVIEVGLDDGGDNGFSDKL